MFEQIDKSLILNESFTLRERELFHSMLKYKKVRKKTILLQQGEVCNFEAFIIKGCLRSYFVNQSGGETILHFALENLWVTDLESFTKQIPSNMFIETLEDSEMLTLDYPSKVELCRRVPKFESLFHLLTQCSLFTLQGRFHNLVSKTAEQRYIDFIEQYPEVAQRVPQHQIARYLCVSPEFLSKIRNTIFKRKELP
ncbi:MAG: Crp/Fnr family transcriptional regulator [Filimonas sp.]|nr:Crp/Fnr family transcriptional regulator [Filimonas sp.]